MSPKPGMYVSKECENEGELVHGYSELSWVLSPSVDVSTLGCLSSEVDLDHLIDLFERRPICLSGNGRVKLIKTIYR